MPVKSLPEDKSKIVFHAVMMSIQNMGFFKMYFDLAGGLPYQTSNDVCADLRGALLFMAMTCFCVGFLCVGMGLGG